MTGEGWTPATARERVCRIQSAMRRHWVRGLPAGRSPTPPCQLSGKNSGQAQSTRITPCPPTAAENSPTSPTSVGDAAVPNTNAPST